MSGDRLLTRAEGDTRPDVMRTADRLRVIIRDARDYTPYQYECACVDLTDALADITDPMA